MNDAVLKMMEVIVAYANATHLSYGLSVHESKVTLYVKERRP